MQHRFASFASAYSRRDRILGVVAACAFLGGRGLFLRQLEIPVHVFGTLATVGLLFFAALELLRGASRWSGLFFAATFVGVVLGMAPVAEAFATWTSGNVFAKLPQLWFPITGMLINALGGSVLLIILLFVAFALTVIIDLILMLVWLMIILLLGACLSFIAPFAATFATMVIGAVFFTLFRLAEAPLAKQQ